MNSMDKWKKEYEDTPVPDELNAMIRQTIAEEKRKRKTKRPVFRNSLISAAAAAALFIGSLNVSPAFAQSLSEIPVIGSFVSVLTVHELNVSKNTYEANIKTPAISGLHDGGLQAALNEKYAAENKQLYEQFEKEIAELEKAGGGYLGVDAGYEVLTDTDRILSIMRYEVTAAGSSSTELTYDTVDKVDNVLITLPSLFTSDAYIEDISVYITEEMNRQMKTDESVVYFTKETDAAEGFTVIDAEQDFYITDQGKLVISFDKYEVAPGFMGDVTFEIPTAVLQKHLISDLYIH